MHMHGNGARLLIGRGLNKIHMAMQSLIGHRLRGNIHLLPLANLRQLLFVHIGLDPDLVEIGNREQRVTRIHILPLRHLAIDDCCRWPKHRS